MKSKILIYCVIFLLIVTGCSKGQSKKNEGTPSGTESHNTDQELNDVSNLTLKIYDKNDNVIGNIECYGLISLLDGCLFYPNLATDSSYENNIQNFYLYDIETKENFKLGTLENVIFAASYDRVLLNDHLYIIFTTGNYYDRDSWMYNLVDFNLKEKTMDILVSEKNDYMYDVMDSFGDSLLIVKHASGISSVEKYDIENNTFTTLKEYKYDYMNETGETIYKVYYNEAENNIYTLRCKFNGSDATSLFIDKNNKNMDLISSTDISGMFNAYDEETNESEKAQPVFGFFCQNDYMYYESRSTSRIVGKLDKNGITSLVNDDPKDYASSLYVTKNSSERIFYKPFDEGCPIFVLNTDNGDMVETSFKAKDDERYCIDIVYQCADKILLSMCDIESHAPDEREPRLYLLELDDILK